MVQIYSIYECMCVKLDSCFLIVKNQALKVQSEAQLEKSFDSFPPPVNPFDSNAYVDAISGRIYFLHGNACECVCCMYSADV